MSPIIRFHGTDQPPPFAQSRSSLPRRIHFTDEDNEDAADPVFPPSYPPAAGEGGDAPVLAAAVKAKHRRGIDDYGDYEGRGDEAEENGLLYEMDILGGRGPSAVGSAPSRPESASARRARGAARIGGSPGNWSGLERPSRKAWKEIWELAYEAMPTLLFTLLGLIFTGELLEHLSHWKVFESVDELFILVPMLANLKGNLEMCLGARLSTSANIGELDSRPTRRAMIIGQLSLLQLQALAISALAAVLSYLLGLTMPHRISPDDPASPLYNATLAALSEPRNLAVHAGFYLGQRDDPDAGYIDTFKEGWTPPGMKELVMVLATGMLAATLSGGILGSFVSALVVLSRRLRINPDNICTPIAACLSDLVTLFVLGLIGSLLIPYVSTPIPFLFLPVLAIAGGCFLWSTLRNEYVKGLIRGGWTPLFGAMTISSMTGVVLERCVSRYEGYAILAVAMTGLSGAVGSIHASRLSTILHSSRPPPMPHSSISSVDSTCSSPPLTMPSPEPHRDAASPRTIALALFFIALPVQAFFLIFVNLAGWMRPEWQLIVSFVLVSSVTVIISIWTADRMTLLFWSRNLDPDSYTLPIHSSLIDLVGQILLVIAFELAAALGGNVRVIAKQQS